MTSGSAHTTVADALMNARRLLQTHPSAAARQATEIIRVEPRIAESHLIFAAALQRMGRKEDAKRAEKEGVRRSAEDPVAMQASKYIAANRLDEAEEILKQSLNDTPHDPETLRLLAQIAQRTDRPAQAEYLLRRCLRVAPGYERAKADLDGLVKIEGSLVDPTVGERTGEEEFGLAIRLNEEAVARDPSQPNLWLSYGHVLRIAGRSGDAVQAYRRAIELDPAFGGAWWSIADLKTVKFTEDDIRSMQEALHELGLSEVNKAALHFALGKAFADAGKVEQAFDHYSRGNRIRADEKPFDTDKLEQFTEQAEAIFTPAFFESRQGQGAPEPDSIFIVGLPRSGSTLLEQMLSCHSQIEPTDELIYINRIGNFLAGRQDAEDEIPNYLGRLEQLTSEQLRTAGTSYLINSLPQRKFGKRFFIDKAPPNWLHVGLIQMILPNAKIIDIRRHPLACGFSNFVQNFATGREFSYDLSDIGRYYVAYVQFMAHMDRVLPGKVHHVRYEDLIQNPARELQQIFSYLGMEFEESCLRFHESRRSVKTSSSEQVRQPISSDNLDRWKPFEPWIQPLKTALGVVADYYPDLPPETVASHSDT